MVDEFRASERRVCGLMGIPRMSYRYRAPRRQRAARKAAPAGSREASLRIPAAVGDADQ